MCAIPANGSLDDADQEFEVIAQCLEQFLEAWETSDTPPELGNHVPEHSVANRRMLLSELIKVDLEYRWQERNFPKRIAEYFDEFPELLQDGNPPTDLIYEEFHVRQNSGFPVDPNDYFEQFPDQAEELAQLLGINTPFQSTSIVGGQARKNLIAIEAGQQFDDFDLLSMLGEGAFARVFLAHQRSMQRMVALKVTTDTGAEPQTLAQFDHDNIVRVFDQRPLPEENLHLLYMQYLPGGTLQPLVKQIRTSNKEEVTGQLLVDTIRQSLTDRGETMSSKADWVAKVQSLNWPETVCWLGAQLAAALHYTHERGVLHRDIKPANILLSGEGLPKLADFNVSFSSKVAGITPSTFFGGSLAYMSPEQLEACDPAHNRDPQSLDGRSDLYSLGVVLWELLTGRRPFADEKQLDQEAPEGILKQLTRFRLEGIPDSAWDELPKNCPPGLLRVLKRCLDPDIEKRFATGNELARQLELCTNPRIQHLLHPPLKGATAWLRRYATGMVFLAAAIPNVLAGWFNFEYNHAEIILHLSEETQDTFHTLANVVNAIAYPIGLGLIFWLTSSIITGMKQMEQGQSVPRDTLQRLRQRALKLGHYVAVTCVTLWGAAGLVYPLSLVFTSADMAFVDCMHFFGSLLICGLIAAAYPFFGTTYFSLRVLYPGLLVDDVSASNDTRLLSWVSTACWVYLGIAILVPFMGVMGIVVRMVVEQQRSDYSVYLLGWLSLASFFGLIVMIVFLRPLQKDLATLIDTLGEHSETAR